MEAGTRTPPDLADLERALTRVLTGDSSRPVRVVDRRENVYTSTSATEIVRCRMPDGTDKELFCKYLSRDTPTVDGRVIDRLYEIGIYRDVLQPSAVRGAEFLGSWDETDTERSWIVLEYVAGARRLMHVDSAGQAGAMEAAAGWIGAFHADAERRLGLGEFRLDRCFDAVHYRERLQRMLSANADRLARTTWVTPVIERFEEVVRILTNARQTVIHGEYYPKNVLFREDRVYPVDWETAAIAPGEIDLAMLTENWPTEIVDLCVRAYRSSRYGNDQPADLDRLLDAARLYVQVHWLGHEPDADRPKWSLSTAGDWRLEQLRLWSQRLGMIETPRT